MCGIPFFLEMYENTAKWNGYAQQKEIIYKQYTYNTRAIYKLFCIIHKRYSVKVYFYKMG